MKVTLPPPHTHITNLSNDKPNSEISLHKRHLNRETWLDWVRALAIVSIVFCHCTEAIYPLNQSGWDSAGSVSQIIRTIYFTFGRLGVPLFLFLSGYLLFSRHPCKTWKDITAFIKSKWIPLLICYELWVLIYSAFCFIYWDQFEAKVLLKELLLMQQPPFSHLWYMPMIIGIYLVIPFLSVLFQYLGRKFLYALFFLSLFKSLFGHHLLIDLQYVGSCYITYLLFGYLVYLLKDKWLHKKSILFLCAILFATFFFYVVFQQIASYKSGQGFNVWYSYPWLILCSMVLFPLGYLLNHLKLPIANNLSLAAFAIYLTHNLFLVSVIQYFNYVTLIPKSIQTWLLCMFCIVLSYITFKAITMLQFQQLNKLLFLTK